MQQNTSFLIWAIAIITAATAWSLDGTLIRPNLSEFPALNIVFIEHLLGAILLSPFLIWGWQKIKNMSRKAVFSLLWVSFFGGLIWTLMITKAYFAAFAGETTLSTVIILQKLQPVFALGLAAIILRESLSRRFYMWAAIAIVSGYMIAFESMGRDFLTVNFFSSPAFFALLAAFAYGSSTVFGKSLVTELWFRISSALRFVTTAILAFWALLIFGDILSLGDFWALQWKLFFIIVFTSGAVGLFLYYYGLRKVHASSAGIFELAYPLSWVFFDWYFNGNILSTTQLIFGLLLMTSFFMIIREENKT